MPFPPLPRWVKDKLTTCRNRGRCPPWVAYPDGLPNPPAWVELVPDPEFDDATAWNFIGSGALVTGGQLQFANPIIASSNTIPAVNAEVGASYEFEIKVAVHTGSAVKRRVWFGGVLLYDDAGIGVFTGIFEAVSTTGLIFQAQATGQWFLDYIRLREI